MISSCRGLSLLEVVVAMGLFSSAFIAMSALNQKQYSDAEYALQSLRAVHEMENKLEYFRTRSSTLSAAQGVLPFTQFSSGQTTVSSGAMVIDWQVSSVSAAGAMSSQIKQVTVTATWQDRAGETKTKKLTTMLSQYGEFD